MRSFGLLAKAGVIFTCLCSSAFSSSSQMRPLHLPYLVNEPSIDGDLKDWRDGAFTDGLWDIFRIKNSEWYQPEKNRLTDHGNEPGLLDDLQARYYMAWDSTNLYLGAEVKDNVNDVADIAHKPDRWYYKDCVCWFIEAPQDTVAESFSRGDNAFCFVADSTLPSYGAWWRHGEKGKTLVEERLPSGAFKFVLTMNPGKGYGDDYIIEARINMSSTFGRSDPSWTSPKKGDRYGIQIVHTDPDGGDYGGHFIIYGKGDNDRTWRTMILSDPVSPPERKNN